MSGDCLLDGSELHSWSVRLKESILSSYVRCTSHALLVQLGAGLSAVCSIAMPKSRGNYTIHQTLVPEELAPLKDEPLQRIMAVGRRHGLYHGELALDRMHIVAQPLILHHQL